jgi:hypothetical protein
MASVGTGTVVVVGVVVGAEELVVVSLEVVAGSASGAQAVAKRTNTNRREKRRYMVDLEVVVRSPSRDRAAP